MKRKKPHVTPKRKMHDEKSSQYIFIVVPIDWVLTAVVVIVAAPIERRQGLSCLIENV